MKSMKSVWTVALAAVALGSGLASQAQTNTVTLGGVGSSALIGSFAQASQATAAGTFKFYGSTTGATTSGGEGGNLFITVDTTGGNRVINYYLQVDSTVGNRAFFRSETLTINTASLANNPGDSNYFTVSGVGSNVGKADADIAAAIAFINGRTFNTGLTDITPADALVATSKALAQNYNGTTNPIVGQNSAGSTSAANSSVNVIGFSLSSRAFALQTVGAAPIVIAVNTTNTAAGHFGDTRLTDINRFVLAGYLDGTFTRTRDAFNSTAIVPGSLNEYPAFVYIRELLSGTYNVTEFCIPASREVASSQDGFAQPNPLNEPTANGGGGGRIRVIGTGASVARANATTDAMTYAFYSTGNFSASNSASLKYITVDGVDPLQDTYTTGALSGGGLNVTLNNIKTGRYAIWSLLRAVTDTSPTSALTALIGQATVSGGGTNFAPANSLTVFRSHRFAAGQSPNNGVVGSPERGADAGGAIFTKQAELDYNNDTGGQLVNVRQ